LPILCLLNFKHWQIEKEQKQGQTPARIFKLTLALPFCYALLIESPCIFAWGGLRGNRALKHFQPGELKHS